MQTCKNLCFEYADLVQSVNFLLTADVVFIVCKYLEPGATSTHRVAKVQQLIKGGTHKHYAYLRLLANEMTVHRPVMMHQQVDKILEKVRLVRAERASRYLIHGLLQLRDMFVVGHCIITEKRTKRFNNLWWDFIVVCTITYYQHWQSH